MKRKLMLAVLLLMCTMLLCACGSSGPKATSEEFFTWIVTVDGNAVVTGYTGNEQLVIIPSKLDGKKVVGIGEKAFYENTIAVKVEVPKGVTTIGNSAFYECKNLESITLPDTVKRIEGRAFCVADKLSYINMPKNLEYIGGSAFAYCHSLKMDLVLPESMTYMGEDAFEESGITGVTISCDIQRDGDSRWFRDCTNLKTVVYKDGVTAVHFGDFYGLYVDMEIDSMTIPASVTTFYKSTDLEVRDVTQPDFMLHDCRIKHVYVEEGSAAHTLFTSAMSRRYFCYFSNGGGHKPFTGAIN